MTDERSGTEGLTASTQVVGVVGWPVEHSLSPTLHNAAFAALGLNWVSVGFPVAPDQATAAFIGARELGVRGLSVTMPHKEAAVGVCDRLSPAAARLGAVNCLVAQDGQWMGHNTDGEGLVAALATGMEFDPAGQRCLVVGAGGAARSVIAALADAGAAEVVVVNRTSERATAAAAVAGSVGRTGPASLAAEATLVVNATPAGMAGVDGSEVTWPVDPSYLGKDQVVVDLVYEPSETPWLAAVRANGAQAANGLGMLVHQAAAQIALWTGQPAPVASMWSSVADLGR